MLLCSCIPPPPSPVAGPAGKWWTEAGVREDGAGMRGGGKGKWSKGWSQGSSELADPTFFSWKTLTIRDLNEKRPLWEPILWLPVCLPSIYLVVLFPCFLGLIYSKRE